MSSQGASTTKRVKLQCNLKLLFEPRAGKQGRQIKSRAKVSCNRKMPQIWTTVRLEQTPGKDKQKKTTKKDTRNNAAVMRTFCPRQARDYKIIGRSTVKLPPSADRKFLKLHKSGTQSGRCR